MTEREASKRIQALKAGAAVLALILAAAAVFAIVTRSHRGAGGKVRADLEMLQTTESAGSQLDAMHELLTKESGEEFDEFLEKVRDFDYEIIGTETVKENDANYTKVNVRIRTRDFGSEYLAAWADYLKENSDVSADDDDLREFYGMLFGRLAGLEKKSYIKDVTIVAIDPIDNDEWITDISGNEELQDALFGGMIGEMRSLAEE